MDDVFISYQRGTEVAAQRVVKRLRDMGWDVWIDADLPPHRAYTDIISEKLEAAKSVVVLWSAPAAQSEWVRAEADHARQHRKLVQATLDGSIPPMPFNQIQCANLTAWDEAEWAKITTAIADLSGREPVQAAAATRWIGGWRKRPSARAVGVAVAALVGLVAITGAAAWWTLGAAKPDRVAILPFRVESQAATARYFADSLTDQTQDALTNLKIPAISRSDADALQGADQDAKIARLGVRLLFDGTVLDDGKTTDVTVHLNDTGKHVTLWSEHFTGATNAPDKLRAHIGAVISGVLTCSARALRPKDGLSDPEVLIQYLIACDRFAQQGEDNQQMTDQMLTALRQVTTKAPSFAPAHAALAKFLAYTAAVLPPDPAAASRAEAKTEAQTALRLEPKNADAYVALELLEPAANWSEREALLRKGLAGDPDWPHANGFLSQVLAEVGRLDESLAYSRKAAAADALGESWAGPNVVRLAEAGHPQESDAAAAQRLLSWPDSVSDWFFRFQAHLYSNDWNAAQANLREPIASVVLPPADMVAQQAFLAAAKSRAPGDVAKARLALLDVPRFGLPDLNGAIAGLGTLGDLDDAFRLAQTYQPGLALTAANTEFLFGPQTAPLRHDPRFMQLATRIGLLKYWRTTGKWPDFCRDPTLPYRCQ